MGEKIMELIYVYIEKFDNFIFKQGIQLSNDFNIENNNGELLIKRNKDYLKNFYGENISNISVLVGKNGSGKTTILDILGMDREDRLKNSIKKKSVKDEYFLLYYIGRNDDGDDMYGIEVMGENVLSNMIKNIDNGTDDEIYDKSKTSIGKVYKYENNILKSINKHYFDYRHYSGREKGCIKHKCWR